MQSRRDELGQFMRVHEKWSLDNFNSGFIANMRGKKRYKVYVPNHKRGNDQHYVLRSIVAYEIYHNIVVPKTLEIHHINENTLDDSIENLQLVTKSEHRIIHNRTVGRIITRVCKYCGKEFEIQKHRLKEVGRGKYCSQECFHNHNVGKNHHNYIRKKVICEQCGKEFEVIPSKNRRFCSHSCSAKNHWNKGRGVVFAY